MHIDTNGDVWPVTITRARYGGTYSGSRWHAWALRPDEVPDAAYGSDTVCAQFWGFGLEPREGSVWDEGDPSDADLCDFRGSMKATHSECKADEYLIGTGDNPRAAYEDLRTLAQSAKANA